MLDRTELTPALLSSRYLRYLQYIHSDLLLRLVAALQEKCTQKAIAYRIELVFSNGKSIPKRFYGFLLTNQLQHPHSESATLSSLEQAVTTVVKGAHMNETSRETPGKGGFQSSEKPSVALQHTNMQAPEV